MWRWILLWVILLSSVAVGYDEARILIVSGRGSSGNGSLYLPNQSYQCAGGSGEYIYNVTWMNGVASYLCDVDSTGASVGDGNNYTTEFGIVGSGTKTWSLNRTGLPELTGTFTDIDTDTDDQLLNEIGNPNTTTNLNMANFDINFAFNQGTFNINQQGAFSNDLVHIHQHTGNPTAGSDLLHLEATDADVVGLNVTTAMTTSIYTSGDIQMGTSLACSVGNGLCLNTTNFNTQNGSYYSTFYLASNPSNYITDGNTNWDNTYNFATQGNITTQNTTTWEAIGLKMDKANFSTQNDSYYTTFWKITDGQTNNNSVWSAINSKQASFNNASTQCTGTDKVYNVTSINGVITALCTTDQTGGASGGDNSGWVNNSIFTDTNGVYVNYTMQSLYLGGNGVDEDKFIWFSEDTSDTGEYFAWNNTDDGFFVSDRLRVYNDIIANGNIGTTEDFYTTGSADNLWLGSTTLEAAPFQAYATGDLNVTGSIRAATQMNTSSFTATTLASASCDVKAYSTNGTLYCGTDATGAGGANQWYNDTQNLSVNGYNVRTAGHFLQHRVPVVDYNAWFCDFTTTTYATSSCNPDYLGVVTGTGGISAAVATSINKTVGLYSISKGTAANSGYRWVMSPAIFLLQGNESFTTKLSLVQPVTLNVTLGILGFCDATTITTTCVDGVFFNITANATASKIKGNTAINSVVLSTTSNYNITYGTSTFYTYKIMIVNHTYVNFSIYNDVKTLVWSDVISNTAAVPITAGRETGSGVWLGTQTAGAAAAIISNIDYILTEQETDTRWIP